MLNLYEEFEKVFQKNGDKTLLFSPEQNYTALEICRLTAKIANQLLALGLKPGERVAVQVEKSSFNMLLYLACLRAGIIYLPLNSAYTEEELSYFFDDAEPRLIFCNPKKEAVILKLVEKKQCEVKTIDSLGRGEFFEACQKQSEDHFVERTKPDDIAVILYTSGTTGKPKGAMITHGGLFCNAQDLKEAWGITEKDTVMHMLPLYHVHGLFFACHPLLLAGGSILLLPKFEIEPFFAKLPRCSIFMGVPTYYSRLLSDPRLNQENCHGIRLFISGSAPLLSSTFNEFMDRTGHILLERYGMTETGINTSNPLVGQRKVGSVGLPLKSIKVRIANEEGQVITDTEVGEIQIKGGNLFKGYWRKPEKTAEDFTEDGYFKTGDLGQFDKDGFLSIVGRKKDLVITGGLNVYPKELEITIDGIEGVSESAVIGIPHHDFGEAVVAVVAGNAQKLTEASIMSELKKHHAGFKCPKKVFFVDQLPKNAMGKVQKNLLRKQFEHVFVLSAQKEAANYKTNGL